MPLRGLVSHPATGVGAPLLAVALLLASLCQWLAGPVSTEPASLGMGAPLPVSWDAAKPAAASATTTARFDVPYGGLPAAVRLELPSGWTSGALEATAMHLRERLLLLGQLQLDGG